MNTDLLSDLYRDGDTIELPDGRSLTLTLEADYDASLDDAECFGEFQWTEDGWYGSERPSGWTCSLSRILDTERRRTLWWRPLPEVWGRSQSDDFTADFEHAQRIYRDGFTMVILTMFESLTDSFGEDHKVEVLSMALGGVDSDDPSYINDIVRDLAHEMGIEL